MLSQETWFLNYLDRILKQNKQRKIRENKMKKLLSMLSVLALSMSVYGQGFGTDCPTLEQQQAAYNRSKAASITVVNTSTQQLQCYYQQLATYWQQLDKSNQQLAKDKQQIEKDIQQIATDKQLAEKIRCLNTCGTKYDELTAFINVILPKLGECNLVLKEDLKKIHTNRSGGGDGTNPGGGGNIRGFDNPGYLIAR